MKKFACVPLACTLHLCFAFVAKYIQTNGMGLLAVGAHPQMISAEAPMLFATACEMFILEITLRSWYQTEESKRRTLQRSDVEDAVHGTEIFDFLIDTVPRQSSAPTQPQMHQQKPTPVQPTLPPASVQNGTAGAGSTAPGPMDSGEDSSVSIKTEEAAVTPSGDDSGGGDRTSPSGEVTG